MSKQLQQRTNTRGWVTNQPKKRFLSTPWQLTCLLQAGKLANALDNTMSFKLLVVVMARLELFVVRGEGEVRMLATTLLSARNAHDLLSQGTL